MLNRKRNIIFKHLPQLSYLENFSLTLKRVISPTIVWYLKLYLGVWRWGEGLEETKGRIGKNGELWEGRTLRSLVYFIIQNLPNSSELKNCIEEGFQIQYVVIILGKLKV